MTESAGPDIDVSIIIPAYNAEPFIERTVRSAAAQTLRGFEILVVNDGSTDGTARILERLAAEIGRLRIITIANSGVAIARNTGIAASRAPFVAFLDADDVWHPTKLEKQMAALAAHPEGSGWAACYCLFRNINLDDECMGDGATRRKRGAFFPSHLTANHVGNGSSLLVRREAAVAVGGFEPSYAAQNMGGCEDWDFQLRLLQHYRIEVVTEFLVGYRTYPGNMSSNFQRMARGSIAVCAAFEGDPRLPAFARSMAWAAHYQMAMLYLLLDRDWRGVWRSLAASFRHDPGYMSFIFRHKAPPLAWPILKAGVAKVIRTILRRPKKPRPPPAVPRRPYLSMPPEVGVLPPEAAPKMYRRARLDDADAEFDKVLDVGPAPAGALRMTPFAER